MEVFVDYIVLDYIDQLVVEDIEEVDHIDLVEADYIDQVVVGVDHRDLVVVVDSLNIDLADMEAAFIFLYFLNYFIIF